MEPKRKRVKLSKNLQVAIFRRDGWLCCWCKKPVIFGPVMKLLEKEVRKSGCDEPLAYYHAHWTRHSSPLMDELGAVLDHVEPFANGGACDEQNLATACAKCNGRKSSASLEAWDKREKQRPIKGKYGEPQHWDGLSRIFVTLVNADPGKLSSDEKGWLKALGS